jgi:hypothetical protein
MAQVRTPQSVGGRTIFSGACEDTFGLMSAKCQCKKIIRAPVSQLATQGDVGALKKLTIPTLMGRTRKLRVESSPGFGGRRNPLLLVFVHDLCVFPKRKHHGQDARLPFRQDFPVCLAGLHDQI